MYLNRGPIEMDKVFINGIIYSMDKNEVIYEAMGIKDGKIVSLGTNESVLNVLSNEAEIIDLEHKLVLPGFIDTHAIIPESFISNNELDFSRANSLDEYLDLIQQYNMLNEDKEIIYGYGWKNEILIDSKEYCINSLDKLAINKPIILLDNSGSALWLNSIAVNYLPVSKDLVNMCGIYNIYEIPGVLRSRVIELINIDKYRRYFEDNYIDGFMEYQNKMISYGITTIGCSREYNFSIPIEIYREIELLNELKIRIIYGENIKPKDVCGKTVYEQINELRQERKKYSTELFRISEAEFVIDGLISMKNAYLFKPYRVRCKEKGYVGDNPWDELELKEGIKTANRFNLNVDIDARGDNAVRCAIEAIEYSIKNNIINNCRNSIMHLDLITSYYIRRMKMLNINAVISPYWFYKNQKQSKLESLFIGEDRCHRLYPVKSFLDSDIKLSFASDYYISTRPNPLAAIKCSVMRNLYDYMEEGYPQNIDMNDSRYRLNPREKISIIDAVKALTIDAAYILGIENETGSLKVGKKADFIVLNENIFEEKIQDISNAKVINTYFNGDLIYEYDHI